MDKRFVPIFPFASEVSYGKKDQNRNNDGGYPFIGAYSMIDGDDKSSYANNSLLQRKVIEKTRTILVEAVGKMFRNLNFPVHLQVVDLGCSIGMNTFLVVSEIVNTIDAISQKISRDPPEFNIFLNDLPSNDFNACFKSIPFFNETLKQNKRLSCFIFGAPGSFYSRLFSSKSIHFAHSSYSLHWLSKVPEGLQDNKRSVYITLSNPLSVYQAYLDQFQRDFCLFLKSRLEEVISNGCMVLTFIGRSTSNPLYRDCCHFWTLLSQALLDLIHEGLVRESELDSFNMPFYDPNEEEVREIIQKEGSFEINKIETHEFNLSDSNDNHGDVDNSTVKAAGQTEANCIRAVSEPLLVGHFGDAIIDSLFAKYAKHVAQHAGCLNKTTVSIVVSLTKK